jgi:hypothetical protein
LSLRPALARATNPDKQHLTGVGKSDSAFDFRLEQGSIEAEPEKSLIDFPALTLRLLSLVSRDYARRPLRFGVSRRAIFTLSTG